MCSLLCRDLIPLHNLVESPRWKVQSILVDIYDVTRRVLRSKIESLDLISRTDSVGL